MFITFEGPEGSGKTTQMAALADFLRQQGCNLLTTREPGGTEVGNKIRNIVLDPENTDLRPRTEILLFQASRAQLVEQIIRPHLAAGGIVLCDRYADSTLAYQGYGLQEDMAHLRTIVDFATRGLKPDLTLLLDILAEEGLRRRIGAGGVDRLDAKDIHYHQRVRSGYLALAAEEPGRWVTIDAARPPVQVQAAIRRVIVERLNLSVQVE